MRNLPFLLLLFGLLGCGVEIVSDLIGEAQYQMQSCVPTRGQELPILAQYPAAGATGVDPHSVVVVEIDTSQMADVRYFGITPQDSADSSWRYVTGGGEGRLFAFVEVNGVTREDAPDFNPILSQLHAVTFAEIATIRTRDSFSDNSVITIEVRANCYEPYIFSFTTGDG